jgi:hypothetical protein
VRGAVDATPHRPSSARYLFMSNVVFLVADGYFLCVVPVDGHHFQKFIWVVALFYLFKQ